MKALVFTGVNEPLSLQEVDKPVPDAHEVLIQIKTAALNHRDLWIQKGQYAGIKFPVILGSDGAGIVTEVGSAVDTSWLGKSVIINPGIGWGSHPFVHASTFKILGMPDNGTFAEYVKVPVSNIVPKPDFLSWKQAAALPLGGLTAYRALFTRARLLSTERILITGIGGGVAQILMQFALAARAQVYVTSGMNVKIHQAVRLGAKAGANYHQDDWVDQLKAKAGSFDVIVDSAGGEGFAKLIELADVGGRIVSFGGTQGPITQLIPARIFWKQLSILGTTMGSEADFKAMVNFVKDYYIVPVVSKEFLLAEGNEALAYMAAAEQFGKIVLKIDY